MTMIDEPFTPDEQLLIERLRTAPQPELSQEIIESIRLQIFEELDSLPPSGSPSKPSPSVPAPVAVVIAIVVVVIIAVVLLVANSQQELSRDLSGTPRTEVIPTVELETEEPLVVPTVEATPELSAEVTSEVTPEITPEATPETTPEPTDEPEAGAPLIVVEGPVEEINVSTITIFDINIQVDPSDPVLTQIQIGDTLRVEGETSFDNNVIVIVAVNITIIDVDIFIVTDPGVPAPGGLPTNCKRTKKGKITCKKTSR